MKERIFNLYAKRVGELYNLSPEELFKKSKTRECVDARHLLYYLCSKRPMRITYIQKYMKENGMEKPDKSGILSFFECYKNVFGLKENIITQRKNISYKEFSKDITYLIKCIPDSRDLAN